MRVVQASTSEVYGDPEQHPQPETYVGHVDCLGPRACYDEGKRAAETLCVDYANERGVDVRVARIFNTYGPHMAVDDGRVVSNLVMQALRREPLTVYGDGEQTRSFCYVSDLVRGLLALMDGDELGVERVGPFNLGNPEEITIKDLAVAVRDAVVGCTSAVLHRGSLKGDPRRRKPDITKALTVLGWEPTIPLLPVGLGATVGYFAATMDGDAWRTARPPEP